MEVQEKKMFELHMGTSPATTYFQELEVLATKAGQRHDTDARGLMDYGQWKARITNMYDERQKKWAFDQALRMVRDNRGTNDNCQKQQQHPTATSHHKTGGATSSPSGKPTSSTAPSGGQRDAGGRWLSRPGTTFGGQGTPMDIGQMRAKGLCFRCHKQGHLSKDCPEKKDFRDIRSVQATNEPVTESKIEEDLQTGARLSSAGRSQSSFVVLSVEEYNDDIDIPLKGCNNASPARAEAKAVNPAGHEAESLSMLPLRKLGQTGAKRHTSSPRGATQPMKVLDETSPTIVTPIDNASLPRMTDGTQTTFGSAIATASVEPRPDGETTARLPGQERVPHHEEAMAGVTITKTAPSELTVAPESVSLRGKGETGNSASAVQAQPVVLRNDPLITALGHSMPRQTSRQEPQARPSKAAGDANAMATKERAIGQEAASAQAVNRGHSVTMIKVPDQDDDTAFQIWLAKERTLAIAKKEATSDEPARSSTTGDKPSSVPPKSDPHRWLKPFEVDWTLRAVCEAQNDNTAHAALFVWTHRDHVPELTKELLSELRLGGERAQEQLYELCEPPRYLRRRQNGDRDFTLNVQLNPCTGRQTHALDTQKAAIPIAVYNADGTRNQVGDITEFVEFRMTIGNHSECIDLAVTNLGSKDLYLGHDWLKHHNPVINWKTGTIIFGRCQCVKNPFPLPDADPDDRWDEELEDGDRILTVNMEEELVIRAVHHANDLAAAANTEKPKKTFEEMVPSDYLPNAKSTLNCKVYPLNWDEQEQLDKFLDENLESGHITESKSPFASPFFFVKKKDGSLRPVQDYRKLNEMTIKNRYPLLLISELIDKLQGAKYFTKLDVCWGYNNVQIKEGNEHKAAFRTNRGLFEPTVMFFGLTNSPATFQWMMNNIFKDLISEGKVTIYLNNILIFTKTLDEHRRIVQCVLQRLRENKLFLKAEKCEFEVLETEYLGVIISEGQVRMDPVKLAGIAKWPTPTKKKELQSFLGFTNFYRKFIKNYSKVVRVLTQLTGKAEWTWGTAQNQAFQQLKKQMAEDVILAIPNKTGRFQVEADASNGAIGAVLSQEQGGVWRPVAFMSKVLTATERNYEIYDKELLAIMLTLSDWRHYLMGALEDIEIWMDHQNLQYFRKPQKLNRRQARWVTELAEYHFVLKHKPGTANVKADLLSR
ncbi:uncharacterized protein ARMOST_06277 [Armillaria ostoyae]|uniref:RNA-directed DNA polymerase n=1 Tax=Armillaria ostoyae TaxID=47428 RepID=A0A284R2K8_ARMOS|nr:uncharacterized protein ARMOST_06277 [Armillaria ostoyae]